MQPNNEITLPDQKTASQRGGYISKPVSPLMTVVFTCGVLAFIWINILSSPASVYASRGMDAINSPVDQADNLGSSSIMEGNSANTLSPIFTPEVMHWADRILVWSGSAGLDPNLVATVMQIESCGDPMALSRSGAMGLFQVMPYHFISGEDPYDPDVNAKRGLDYLYRALLTGANNPRMALAGYNGGVGVIGLPELEWSSQTTRYVYWGTGIFADAAGGLDESSWLLDWYQTSGASMCRQAHARLGLVP